MTLVTNPGVPALSLPFKIFSIFPTLVSKALKLWLVFRFKVEGILTNFNCLFSLTSNSLETEAI